MAHIHEKIDFTVDTFIVFGNKVLLRKHDKYNIWLPVGGHIKLDEDPNEAAVREIKEEVGLDVKLWDGNMYLREGSRGNKPLIPPVAINRHHTNETHEHVDMLYFAKATSDQVKVMNEDDRSDEWRWLTKEELEDLDLREDVRFYASMAIDELGA